MSSGILDNTIRARQADGSSHARWGQPGERASDVSPRDRAGAHLHLQPELPSRRWYLDATRDFFAKDASDAPEAQGQRD